MRAYKTTPTTGYVDWIVNDQPDSTGTYSGYNPAELTNITVNKIVQSKIDNFLKPLNSLDGYFFHLNSYDWIHPPTSPYAATQSVPPQITGLSAVRGYTAGPTPRDHACMFWDETLLGWKFAYNTAGDGVTIGASLPVFTGTLTIDGYLAVGTDPAQSGVIRIPNTSPNDSVIRGRNSTNTADVDIVQVDTSNRVKLGSVTDPVYVTHELLVGDHISHGLTDAATTGFIRLENTDGIHSRNDAGIGNLNLIETIGDEIYIGDSSNIGIVSNVGSGYVHKYLVNDVAQLEIGLEFIRFDIDVDNPKIYQTTQTVGNGQPLTIQAQNTAGNTGGSLVLASGTGAVSDSYVQIKNGTTTKIQVEDVTTLLYTSNLTFEKDVALPIISQETQTTGSGQLLTINAQSASGVGAVGGALSIAAGNSTNIGNGGALSVVAGSGGSTSGNGGLLSIIAGSAISSGTGGNLILSSGQGSAPLTSGSIIFEYGLAPYGHFNVDSWGAYFDIGLNPAASGSFRVPNNLAALSARDNANIADIYLIGTDASDNIIIGDAASTTIISGNLTVLGVTTTIHSTIVDIADRVVHFNYTEGVAPVPILISGISVDRGSPDGVTNRDAASVIWNETDGYWKFGYVNEGDDLTLNSILPIVTSSVNIMDLPSDIIALSGKVRVKNNVIGAAARNSANTADIEVWQTDASDILKIGTISNDTNIDGYNVRINTNLTGDILFDTNDQAEHIYFDGLQKLYVNLMGSEPYLKAENGAYIDLPGTSLTSSNNFAIDGYHVDGYVTAPNLNTLCNGSNADLLHTHTGSSGDGYHSIIVGSIGGLSNATDGYLLTGLIELSDESFPAYVVNSNSTSINRLVVTCSQIPGPGESVVITVRLNNVDTLLSVTVDDSTPSNTIGYIESNLINNIDAVYGDHITIRFVSSAAANVQNIMATIKVI